MERQQRSFSIKSDTLTKYNLLNEIDENDCIKKKLNLFFHRI